MALDNGRLHREAQAASRAKDEFLAMVSHELRSPLAAIRMWAAALRGGRLTPEEIQRATRAIETNTATQARLVGDLLDVSCIVSGKLRLDEQPTDVADAARAALDAVRAAAAQKQIRLEASFTAAPVRGDPGRLQQIVWNLVGNAVKFTPEGGHVEVRLEREGESARLTVRDDGAGIAADVLPHVFERFRQGGDDVRRQGGLGLGLAIVRYLAEAHGGRVEVSSAGPGCGASFVVTLPLRAAEEVDTVAAATERAAATNTTSSS
jgi:signal transduction histidine kinase